VKPSNGTPWPSTRLLGGGGADTTRRPVHLGHHPMKEVTYHRIGDPSHGAIPGGPADVCLEEGRASSRNGEYT